MPAEEPGLPLLQWQIHWKWISQLHTNFIFCFQLNHPSKLSQISQWGCWALEISLCSCTMNSVILTKEGTEGDKDLAARLAGWFWLLSKGGGTFNHLGSSMICWVISGFHGSKCLAKYEPQCYQSINQNRPLLPPQINPLISVLIKKSVKADKCLPQR